MDNGSPGRKGATASLPALGVPSGGSVLWLGLLPYLLGVLLQILISTYVAIKQRPNTVHLFSYHLKTPRPLHNLSFMSSGSFYSRNFSFYGKTFLHRA